MTNVDFIRLGHLRRLKRLAAAQFMVTSFLGATVGNLAQELKAQPSVVSASDQGSTDSQAVRFIIIDGLKRTDKTWFLEQLGIDTPFFLDVETQARLRRKILSTGLITDVVFEWNDSTLTIRVEEKWTLIPVVRGVYGGGTPLSVLGVYDINVLGRRLTLGAEGRRYGDAPWGGVIYGSDPTFLGGTSSLKGVVQQEQRQRQILDPSGEVAGVLSTQRSSLAVELLRPLKDNWNIGLHSYLAEVSPSKFDRRDSLGSVPKLFASKAPTGRVVRLLPLVEYADLEVDNLLESGTKTRVYWGPALYQQTLGSYFRWEIFHYVLWTNQWNLGLHSVIEGSSAMDSGEQIYLGGFDSIRGMADGVTYGSKVAFANLELRRILARGKYLWVQGLGFIDGGSASQEWGQLGFDPKVGAGFGLRFAIPQVYRLVFRLDFAWDLGNPGHGSFAAGMNQFFQPLKPL